jgi:predicted site-specific integrase-resolvase
MMDVSSATLRRWARIGKAPVIKDETGRLYFPAWWVDERIGKTEERGLDS